MIAFHITDSVLNQGHKIITIDEKVYQIIGTDIKTTYNVLMARLFGLNYAEWCRLARDKYHGTLHGKDQGYITITFADEKDARECQRELNKRWNEFYCK